MEKNEEQMKLFMKGISTYKDMLFDFLQKHKPNNDQNETVIITRNNIMDMFLLFMEYNNYVHIFCNNFIIFLTQYIKPQSYNHEMPSYDAIIHSINDLIHFIIKFPSQHDLFIENIHFMNDSFDKEYENKLCKLWHYKIIYNMRDTILKTTVIINKLNHDWNTLLEFCHNKGERRPSEHEHSLFS